MNNVDPSGRAILTETEEQAKAVIERIRVLTSVQLDPPHELPGGAWIIDPVAKDDPRWVQIAPHVENTNRAWKAKLIDDATNVNRHNLETAAQFGSGINVFVASSAKAILAGDDGALQVIPTDDTAARFRWKSRDIGSLSDDFDPIDALISIEADTLKGEFEKVLRQGGFIKLSEAPDFYRAVLQGFFEDGLGGSLGGLWDLAKLPVVVGRRGIEATGRAGVRTAIELLTTGEFSPFRNTQESLAQEFLPEFDMIEGAVKKVLDAQKSLKAVQREVLEEIARYVVAKSQGKEYELSPKAERALKYTAYMAMKLGVDGLQTTPEQKGRLTGFLLYTATETVVLDLVTGGAAEATRPVRLAAITPKLAANAGKFGIRAERVEEAFAGLNKLAKIAEGRQNYIKEGKFTKKSVGRAKPDPKPVNANDDFVGTLRGVEQTLPGVKTKKITYTKIDPEHAAKARSKFDSTDRPNFMKKLAKENESDLKKAGLSKGDIAKMKDGQVPTGYQVHHKIPIDAGGANDPSNLILMRNEPFHKTITNYQNKLIRGMEAGEIRSFHYPIPEGFIYPPP